MTAALSRPPPGPGDAATWPPYAGHPLDPRAPLDEALEREAESLAEHTLRTSDLARLIAEYDEWALLDCLLDAHRYGTDAGAAWTDLRTGLLQSMTAQIRAVDLALRRVIAEQVSRLHDQPEFGLLAALYQ